MDVNARTERVLELLAEKTKQGKLEWERKLDDGIGTDSFLTKFTVGDPQGPCRRFSYEVEVSVGYVHVLIGNRKVSGKSARRLYYAVKVVVDAQDCPQLWLDELEAL